MRKTNVPTFVFPSGPPRSNIMHIYRSCSSLCWCQCTSCCSGSAHVKTRSVVGLSLAISAASMLCLGPSFVLMSAKIFVWDWAPPTALYCSLSKIEFFILFMWNSWPALNPCTCFVFSKKYRHALCNSQESFQSSKKR